MSDISAIMINYKLLGQEDMPEEDMEVRLYEKKTCKFHDPSKYYNGPFCRACAAGKFSNITDQRKECTNCTEDHYSAPNSTKCDACPTNQVVTAGLGTSEDSCKCPYWMYLDQDTNTCEYCAIGQSTYPSLDRGDKNTTKFEDGRAWLNNNDTQNSKSNKINRVWAYQEPTWDSCYVCEPGKFNLGEYTEDTDRFFDRDPGNCDFCPPDTFSNATLEGKSCFDCPGEFHHRRKVWEH